jgi:hypothetical protein
MKRVDEVAGRFDAINFLVRLETGMENYSLAALADYVKISFKHLRRWNRMAIVSDQKPVRAFYDALSPIVPGKIIGFELKDFEKAKAWVSQPRLTDENRSRPSLRSCIASGLVATSAMTLFSYAISRLAKENFGEPELLGAMFRGWNPSLGEPASRIMGWQAHYSFGIAWATLYELLRSEKHPLATSLGFGSLGGATGIWTWKKLFQLNPKPPAIHRGRFYLQLFFSHLVFGLALPNRPISARPSRVRTAWAA